MNRSKRIFIIVSIVFIAIIIYAVIDIYSKTSPPWKKKKHRTAYIGLAFGGDRNEANVPGRNKGIRIQEFYKVL